MQEDSLDLILVYKGFGLIAILGNCKHYVIRPEFWPGKPELRAASYTILYFEYSLPLI